MINNNTYIIINTKQQPQPYLEPLLRELDGVILGLLGGQVEEDVVARAGQHTRHTHRLVADGVDGTGNYYKPTVPTHEQTTLTDKSLYSYTLS